MMRGRFVMACTLLAAGLLAIVLNAGWRDEAISPGPLARQHAQLLASDAGDSNCSACHAAAERSVAGWTVSLAGFHGHSANQSQRCMECHDSTISKQHALSPHSVDAEVLQKLSAAGEKAQHEKELACAACHREHQGADFNLTAMSDAACQSCHQKRYESFSTDHPDFGNWPYERSTRITFNHASHRAKHFTEKKQAFDCRMCHIEDATQNVQLTAGYEAACASCHDEKIALSVVKGVPMLALPTLDIDALKDAGHDIDEWPADATGDFDGRVPPTMKLLLAGDPEAAKAIATLGADFEFFDIDPDDAAQLAACATLAYATKKLLAELSSAGRGAMRERLKAALGRDVSDVEMELLLGGLPPDAVAGALREWFPAIKLSATNGRVPISGGNKLTPTAGTSDLKLDPAGTWTRDDATFSIRYEPASHADPVMASWLELLTQTTNLSNQPVASAMFAELTNPTAAGLCASCHSVERQADGQVAINWRANDRSKEPRSLTRFSHKPHLLLPQLADCTSCHAINDSAAATVLSGASSPAAFVSEFTPLSKQNCVQCHTQKGAGESCQQCHNYHVEHVEAWRVGATSVGLGGSATAD
jgi:hypothetical protein